MNTSKFDNKKPTNKTPYIKLDHRVKEARALTRTTIALYEALLWFQRGKDSCWPGYEKLGKRAKINSKTTISLHLQVLVKVGLVTKKRRGFKKSNIYKAVRASELTDEIIKKLHRPNKFILSEIQEEIKDKTAMQKAIRELKSCKKLKGGSREIASEQCYPQSDEVQQMDSKKEPTGSCIYSSNLKKDSKFENGIGESRGGGFKSIAEYIQTSFKNASKISRTPQNEVIPLEGGSKPIPRFSPQKKPLQPPTEHVRIREVMLKISADIFDVKHKWENVSQAINIFRKIRDRGVDEGKFVDTLWHVRGLTVEIIGILDRPGAYFFTVLKRNWEIG